MELGPRSHLLTRALLVLSHGTEIFVFQDGAYRLISSDATRNSSRSFEALVELAKEGRVEGIPALDPSTVVYIADSAAPGRIDDAMASQVAVVIDVGHDTVGDTAKPILSFKRGYHRTIDVIVAATAAMHESGRAPLRPTPPDVGDTVLWTFKRPYFPPGRRLCVRVTGSGFVHAGVRRSDGTWDPVYNVPLVPRPEGDYEAVLPSGVNAFTFFWTEAPRAPGHPGHWECSPSGARVFSTRAD